MRTVTRRAICLCFVLTGVAAARSAWAAGVSVAVPAVTEATTDEPPEVDPATSGKAMQPVAAEHAANAGAITSRACVKRGQAVGEATSAQCRRDGGT